MKQNYQNTKKHILFAFALASFSFTQLHAQTYCNMGITSAGEPITLVKFANIDLRSSNETPFIWAWENFTDTYAYVQAGSSYEIRLEGHTDGGFTNYFSVWIDWNQNGVFDNSERYDIGSINNSNGNDGKHALGNIAVPANALEGPTRMRVYKNYNEYPNGPCAEHNYGQAEDYTVVVSKYTTPTNTNNDKFTTALATTGLDVNFEYSGTTGIHRYRDFTYEKPEAEEVKITHSFNFNHEFEGGAHTLKVWADFNNDANFTEDEVIYLGHSASNSLTDQITIPANVNPGTYRLRFRSVSGGTLNSTLSPDANVTDGTTIDFLLKTIPVPLPVEMSDLKGNLADNKAYLNWETYKEVDNRGFEIQKSVDGKNFETIAFVNSQAKDGNSSSKLKYEFIDQKSLTKETFYRLRQVDIDNSFKYSNIIALKPEIVKDAVKILAYPNPFRNTLTVSRQNGKVESAKITIIDLAGKTVYEQNMNADQINIETQDLPNGTYFIKYEDGVSNKTIKVNKF